MQAQRVADMQAELIIRYLRQQTCDAAQKVQLLEAVIAAARTLQSDAE